MTQAEKDKIIAELQEKLAEAEKIKVDEPKQPKRWKPKHNETYWTVVRNGCVEYYNWMNDSVDNWAYLTGNCFKTKEEAEEYKKQIEYTARYKNYIEEHSEPLDWNDENQSLWGLFFKPEENGVDVDTLVSYKSQGTIFASSKQIIEDAIKEIGEDNFKKYVLGVK